MSDELKTCPFCGNQPLISQWSNHGYWRINCDDCDIEMDFYHSREDVIAAWNRRDGA